MVEWPQWWSWELEFSPHLLKRMVDRSFNEADLRLMLENAIGYHENHEECFRIDVLEADSATFGFRRRLHELADCFEDDAKLGIVFLFQRVQLASQLHI